VRARRVEVEHEVRGARVAVARLADGARVEQPAAVGEVDLAAALRKPAREGVAVRQAQRDRDVAVADEDELRRRQLERLADDGLAQHVLPDRVARTRVERLDAVPLGLRLELAQVVERLRLEHVDRPARARRGVRRERRQVDLPERGEVVVAEQTEVGVRARLGDAAVRLRAVADDVSEAPELVDALGAHVVEHRLEGVPVAVNVGDGSDAQQGTRR